MVEEDTEKTHDDDNDGSDGNSTTNNDKPFWTESSKAGKVRSRLDKRASIWCGAGPGEELQLAGSKTLTRVTRD